MRETAGQPYHRGLGDLSWNAEVASWPVPTHLAAAGTLDFTEGRSWHA